MDVTITIPLPVLVSPQYFQVRYRLIGAPSWTSAGNQTNAPFVISGLAAGSYELGVTLAQGTSPEIVCDETITYFEVVDDDYDCLEAELEITKTNDVYQLVITFPTPSPLNPFPCGYEVEYGPVGGPFITTGYASFPISPIIIPVSNQEYTVKIWGIFCDGLRFLCLEENVEYEPGECTTMVLGGVEIVFDNGLWYLVFDITQSNPPSSTYLVAFGQDNTYIPAGLNNSGSSNIIAFPSTTQLQTQIYPNTNVQPTNGERKIFYNGTITDGCGGKYNWSAEYTIT